MRDTDPAVEPTTEAFTVVVTFRVRVEARDVDHAQYQAAAIAETLHVGGVLFEAGPSTRHYNGSLGDRTTTKEIEVEE